jgi:magnesium transporter
VDSDSPVFFPQTGTLEKEAYPALDELTSKISTLNLERVRQIKSRLVAISGRVQKVGN